MAVVISEQTLTSETPAVYGRVEYSSYRSGNNMVYNLTVYMYCKSTGGWRNNRWAARLWVNGSQVWSNQTIKAQTSGTIGTTVYSASTGNLSYAINSGTISVQVQFADTAFSTSWSVNKDWGTYYGSLPVNSPVAPSAPSSATIPSSTAPDKTISVSWGACSGGTNGVTGYELAWSKNGGSNYTTIDVGNVTSYNLNLNSLGFVQNSVLKIAVRSYSTVNGTKYYSDYTYTGSTTTVFVAPSVPKSLSLNTAVEPIPTALYTGTWSAPNTTGTNGIGGYVIQWLKNGSNYGSEIDLGNVLTRNITLNETDFAPGDILSFKVRAYTIGQSNKYYSSYVTSGSITIVSDKYIYVSVNGAAFTKYKMYISVNGASFTEIKKEKFKTIT